MERGPKTKASTKGLSIIFVRQSAARSLIVTLMPTCIQTLMNQRLIITANRLTLMIKPVNRK